MYLSFQLLANVLHLFPGFAAEMSLCTVLQTLVLSGNASSRIAELINVLTVKYNHQTIPVELLGYVDVFTRVKHPTLS